MLGRESYTPEEGDHGKIAVAQQFAAYDGLADAIGSEAGEDQAHSALQHFEAVFFNTATIALDRCFVYRLHPGDRIRLTRADFERLAAAFFTDLERKFL